jgi:hypothetical protein
MKNKALKRDAPPLTCWKPSIGPSSSGLYTPSRMRTKAFHFSCVIIFFTGKSRCRLTGIYDSDVVPGGEGVGLLEHNLARNVYVEQVHLHAREKHNCCTVAGEEYHPNEQLGPRSGLLRKKLHVVQLMHTMHLHLMHTTHQTQNKKAR